MKCTFEDVRYQDYVIKDGKLIGDFEGLYSVCADPWKQSEHLNESRRILAINWCQRLRKLSGSTNIIELGCGYGYLTQSLRDLSFCSVGVDISRTAVQKARALNPGSVFIEATISDFDLLERFDPDVFLMEEITWYVLEELDLFIERLKKYSAGRSNPTYLIHLLTTYAPGVQKYGTDSFTNLDEILSYFDLDFIEYGIISQNAVDPQSKGTYFIARI